MVELTPYEVARLVNKESQIKIDGSFFSIVFCYMAVFSDYRAYCLCITIENDSFQFPVKSIKSITKNKNLITITAKRKIEIFT